MKQKKTLLALALFLFVILLPNAYAVDFQYVNVFSFNNVYDPIAFPGVPIAQNMQTIAIIDSESYSVYFKLETTNPIGMAYNPKWSKLPIYPTGYLFSGMFLFNSTPDLRYQNTVFFIDTINANGTYDTGEPLTNISPRPSGTYQFLPAAQNVQITGGIYPTITWSPVTEAQLYRVAIVGVLANGNPNIGDLKFVTDFLSSTSYTYSGSPLQYGQSYAFFVEARDFLNNDASNPLINLVNQSRYFTEYTPAVPEPTTILLLGSGLIGLAGYGRKKFFRK